MGKVVFRRRWDGPGEQSRLPRSYEPGTGVDGWNRRVTSAASQGVTSGQSPQGGSGGLARDLWNASGLRAVTPAQWTAVGLVALGFVGLFWRLIWTQHLHSRDKPEDWGHAYLMPFFAAWLIWRRREELSRCATSTFWPALTPILLGIACYLYFVVGFPNHMFQGYAAILVLESLVLLLLGPAVFRRVFLPIACVGLGITISEAVMIKITFPLQLVASKGAWLLMSITQWIGGYTVEVEGNTLRIVTASGKEVPLNVAEACSGMRMLIAFYALAAGVALVASRRWWERIAIVLLAAPVAVLMNVIRVAVLGWLSILDPSFSAGDAHMLVGTLLLIPSLGLYLAAVWACGRIIVDPEAESRRLARASHHARRRVTPGARP